MFGNLKKNKAAEKITVNKELLKGCNSLLIVLENCDTYTVAAEDVLDVYCQATRISKDGNEYRTPDGFIKIAARASETVENFVLREGKADTEWSQRLKERLQIASDMTSFSLEDKSGREIDIYVPYNPLEDILHGSEIELSNCPSLEIDEEGNMIIAFGDSSKQPKRKDNNYAELITGWEEAFGKETPPMLKVKLDSCSTFGENQKGVSLVFSCKELKDGLQELIFLDCENFASEMYFPMKDECEIFMSRMMDGKIFVGLDGLGIEFRCSYIWEYGAYCKRWDDEE